MLRRTFLQWLIGAPATITCLGGLNDLYGRDVDFVPRLMLMQDTSWMVKTGYVRSGTWALADGKGGITEVGPTVKVRPFNHRDVAVWFAKETKKYYDPLDPDYQECVHLACSGPMPEHWRAYGHEFHVEVNGEVCDYLCVTETHKMGIMAQMHQAIGAKRAVELSVRQVIHNYARWYAPTVKGDNEPLNLGEKI